MLPCTPPRPARDSPRLTVPHSFSRSRSDPFLHRRLSEDPAHHLQTLLSKHKLQENHAYMTKPTEAEDVPEDLPPCAVRSAEHLLRDMAASLSGVAPIFAPQHRHPLVPGPKKDDTQRFAEYFETLSERARLAANAHRLFASAMGDSEFIIKFLLRPLNEVMACMLLPVGLQVFWRVAERTSFKPRIELVWRQEPGEEVETLAVLEVTSPEAVSDTDMRILLDHVRRGMMTVKAGKLVVQGPIGAPPPPEASSTILAAKAVSEMFDTDAAMAVITNCNRFIVLAVHAEQRVPVVQFSDVVNVSDLPGMHLCQSPLGMLLGVAVHALYKRDIVIRAKTQCVLPPPATLILENLVTEHFPSTLASKRRSHDAKLRRRAIFGEGMYPSQLGASMVRLKISDAFQALLEMHHGVAPLCWASPFHGPAPPLALPPLIPDVTPFEPSWTPVLEVVEFKGQGVLWTVFCARFAWLPSGPADLVLKIFNLNDYPPLDVADGSAYSRLDAVADVCTELGLYAGPLAHLQGSVVPRFHGLMGSYQPDETQQWCALFDDAGLPISASDLEKRSIQHQVKLHYEAIHAAGVLHGAVARQHILQHNHELRLVGFTQAVARAGGESDAEWTARCDAEMRLVSELLGGTSPDPDAFQDAVEDALTDHDVSPTPSPRPFGVSFIRFATPPPFRLTVATP